MTDVPDFLAARLIDLESHLAQHDRALQDISDVVADQFGTIDHLRRDLARLSARLEAVEERAERSAPPDRPPPHY